MPARMWMIILSFAFVSTVEAAPISPQFLPPTVGILLKFERQPSRGFVKGLQEQVAGIFRPTRLDLRWEILGGDHRPGIYDRIVVIQLRGTCELHSYRTPPEMPEKRVQLGWTMVNDGEVLPYAVVDCDRIASVANEPRFRIGNPRPMPAMYLRLAGRVVTHELMHVLLRTPDHNDTDCTRSPLKGMDLQSETRLKPNEIQALRQIGRAKAEALARRD